jgi:hypothetical protein
MGNKSDIKYWITTNRFGNFNKQNDLIIPFKNFEEFHKKYITSYELSFITTIPNRTILKKVNINKLHCISGPPNKDGKRFLFDRYLITVYIPK